MADNLNDTPSSPRSTGAPMRTTSKTSKTSLMLAFAAGAAFSWILMEATDAKPATRTSRTPPMTLAK